MRSEVGKDQTFCCSFRVSGLGFLSVAAFTKFTGLKFQARESREEEFLRCCRLHCMCCKAPFWTCSHGLGFRRA